jgi:uncharacterized protein (DUF305 family)
MGRGKLSRRWGWLLLVIGAAALIAGVALAAGSDDPEPDRASGSNIVQPGAPGEPSRSLTAEEAGEIQPPEHTRADVLFVQGMIHHHAQGVEMTRYVPNRGAGRDIRLLAGRMRLTQQSEIELMTRWLRDRREEVPGAGEHAHGHGGELMPGMLTEPELARLEAAQGRRFNRLFLTFMIRHHQGALTMIDELHDAKGGAEPEVDNMVRHIDADQSIEIARMRDLLVS